MSLRDYRYKVITYKREDNAEFKTDYGNSEEWARRICERNAKKLNYYSVAFERQGNRWIELIWL